MSHRLLLSSTCALVLVLAACGASSGDPTKVTFAPSLGVDLSAMTRSASGLYTQDREVGAGTEATSGRQATVHYTGWLPDGTQFDSSRDRQTFAFRVGAGEVIAGWDEGVAGMKVGGKRLLVLPSSLGYGQYGRGPIPPDSVLVFEVELISVP